MSRKAHAAFALAGAYVAFCAWWLMGVNTGPGLDWLALVTYALGASWAVLHSWRTILPR